MQTYPTSATQLAIWVLRRECTWPLTTKHKTCNTVCNKFLAHHNAKYCLRHKWWWARNPLLCHSVRIPGRRGGGGGREMCSIKADWMADKTVWCFDWLQMYRSQRISWVSYTCNPTPPPPPTPWSSACMLLRTRWLCKTNRQATKTALLWLPWTLIQHRCNYCSPRHCLHTWQSGVCARPWSLRSCQQSLQEPAAPKYFFLYFWYDCSISVPMPWHLDTFTQNPISKARVAFPESWGILVHPIPQALLTGSRVLGISCLWSRRSPTLYLSKHCFSLLHFSF